MRILFYGDLQINASKLQYMRYLRSTLGYLADLIQRESPDLVINLGDTLDSFGKDDAESICFAHHWMESLGKLTGGKHWIITGNHDLQDKDGEVSAVTTFADRYTSVYTAPCIEQGIALLPYWPGSYQENESESGGMCLEELLAEFAGERLCCIAAHLDWLGCRLTPQYISKEGLVPKEMAETFPGIPIFNGHYHTPQDHPPVTFVGAPLWRNFSDFDAGIPRGFTLWDSEAGAIKRIANPHTYYCETMTAIDEEDLKVKLGGLLKPEQTKLKLRCPKSLFPELAGLREDLLWLGIYASDTSRQQRHALQVTSKGPDIVEAAVKQAPPELDKELLTELGLSVYS